MRDMNNLITVVGNVGTDPVVRTHANNFRVTTFRLGTDNRGKNPETGEWETKSTNWYSVKVFHQLGLNAHASIRKGQRVFVAGYARIDQYTREDGSTGIGIDVEAQVVGHDLLFGTSEFSRHPHLVATREDDADGAPSAFTVDGEGPGETPGVDRATGELDGGPHDGPHRGGRGGEREPEVGYLAG